ncbi:hypothetical protein FVA74_08430 [Salinibacterium sp. dk2585]|uniref:hypothetical protein n=1 Tax=Salinibacterium sp. dk5596 TaxID=2603291 RepID=UPI0011C250B3|nr:hypothetical protein [Salinibacterium sp. dk5596]QEE61600.1 hypothetical protein FVA74_08430 [Salinibacterium sp. dk2585]TXK52315.1 hypothetical protein FVP63_13325 [Salinibacterium sp. dk5596]
MLPAHEKGAARDKNGPTFAERKKNAADIAINRFESIVLGNPRSARVLRWLDERILAAFSFGLLIQITILFSLLGGRHHG